MAAAVRSVGTPLALGSRTNSTFTAPSGIVDGDRLYCIMAAGDGGDLTAPAVTPPSGFSQITGFPLEIAKSGYAIGLRVFEKTASSESGNYTFSHASADTQGFILCVSDAGNVSQAISTGSGSSGGPTSVPSVTPDDDGALIIQALVAWDGVGPTSPPTGFTERLDAGVMYVSTLAQATAAATGAVTMSIVPNSGSNSWQVALIIVPAEGGGSGGDFQAAWARNSNTVLM